MEPTALISLFAPLIESAFAGVARGAGTSANAPTPAPAPVPDFSAIAVALAPLIAAELAKLQGEKT